MPRETKQSDIYHMRFFTVVESSLLDELGITGLFPEDFQVFGSQYLGNYVPLWDNAKGAEMMSRYFEDPLVAEVELPYEMNGRLNRMGPGVFGLSILPPRYITSVKEPGDISKPYIRSLVAAKETNPVKCAKCGKKYGGMDLVPRESRTKQPMCSCGSGVMIPLKEQPDYRSYNLRELEEEEEKKKNRSYAFDFSMHDPVVEEWALWYQTIPEEEYIDQCTSPFEEYHDLGEEARDRVRRLQDESDEQERLENVLDYEAYDRLAARAATKYIWDLSKGDTFKFVGRRDPNVYQIQRIEDGTVYYRNPATNKHYRHADPEKAPRVRRVEASSCKKCGRVHERSRIPVEASTREPMCPCGSRVFASIPGLPPQSESIDPAEETPAERFVGRKTDESLRRKNPFRNDDRHTMVDMDLESNREASLEPGDYEDRNEWFGQGWEEGELAGDPDGGEPVSWREDSLLDPFTRRDQDDNLFPEFKMT